MITDELYESHLGLLENFVVLADRNQLGHQGMVQLIKKTLGLKKVLWEVKEYEDHHHPGLLEWPEEVVNFLNEPDEPEEEEVGEIGSDVMMFLLEEEIENQEIGMSMTLEEEFFNRKPGSKDDH